MSLTADAGNLYTKGDLSVGGKLTVDGGAKISIQNKVNGGSGHGLHWYDTDETGWVSYFASAGVSKNPNDGEACTSLDGRTGWHVRHRSSVNSNEGHLWENGLNQCLMSLTTDTGNLFTKGQIVTGSHLGIAKTPRSDWHADYVATEVGALGVTMGHRTGFGHWAGSNWYYDGAYKYITGGQAAQHFITGGGEHIFRVAPSGSTDGLLNWTPAVTIHNDASTTFAGNATFSGSVTLNKGASIDGIVNLFGSAVKPWAAGYDVVQYGAFNARLSNNSDSNVWNTANAYFDGTWRRSSSGYVTNLSQAHNHISFLYGTTGPTDSVVSWNTALTLSAVDQTVSFPSAKLIVEAGAKIGVQNKVDGGSEHGLFLYDTDNPDWGLYMSQSGAGKSLADGTASASLDGRSGFHARFRAGNGATQGFIWENKTEQCLMSLTADTGDFYTKGTINAGSSMFLPHGANITMRRSSGNADIPVIRIPSGSDNLHLRLPGTGVNNKLIVEGTDGLEKASITGTGDLYTQGGVAVGGKLSLGHETVLTISAGAITVAKSFHKVSTEGGAASDDLDTINGGYEGQILVLRAATDSNTVVLKDNTGNMALNGDFSMDLSTDTITLLWDTSVWVELSRSNNG